MPVQLTAEAASLLKPQLIEPSFPPHPKRQSDWFGNSQYWKWAKELDVCGLSEAKFVGQRVRGTSAHSVYSCAAISKDCAVAARSSGGSLSIRVECLEDTAEVGAALSLILPDSPLKKSGSGKHWSVHFNSIAPSMEYSTFMAVLGTVNQSFSLIAPSTLAMPSIMGEE